MPSELERSFIQVHVNMKKTISSILILLASQSLLYCQSISRILEIYTITEYVDGYLIRGVDQAQRDTVSIASVKTADEASVPGYTRILVGKSYKFDVEDIASNISAVPPNKLIVRLKTTVVWKHGDGVKYMPVFSANTKGIWIKE